MGLITALNGVAWRETDGRTDRCRQLIEDTVLSLELQKGEPEYLWPIINCLFRNIYKGWRAFIDSVKCCLGQTGNVWAEWQHKQCRTNSHLWSSSFGDVVERGMECTACRFGCYLQEDMEPVIVDSLNGSVPCVLLRVSCKCLLSSAGIIRESDYSKL